MRQFIMVSIIMLGIICGSNTTAQAQIGCFPVVNQCAPRIWPWPMQRVIVYNPPVVVNPMWVNPNPIYVPVYTYQWVRRPALDGNGNVITDSRGRIVYERVRILVQQ